MKLQQLKDTANAMVADGKGILAMDESNPTCNKRFDSLGIPTTPESRRAYRDMLLTTPDLGNYISGAILFDETIRQTTLAGKPFAEYAQQVGIIPGIKVDTGAKELAGHAGEKVTEGLDGLRDRLAEYVEMGARFAKWRAVITIGKDIPSVGCISANALGLARYAGLCQEAGLVPIVEPEVLIDGDHTIERCFEVTETTLHRVFAALVEQRVVLDGIVLKPNMVISGKDCHSRAGIEEVAAQTVRCLLNTVPASVPGIAFLSGGQGDEEATAHLNVMNNMDVNLPWSLTFSYGRALQHAAMQIWSGDPANVDAAQKVGGHRARMNGAASMGAYSEQMERAA